MGVITSLLRPRAATPGPGHDFWYGPIGVPSATGVPVSVETALRVSAVWACVSLISETLAMLPLHIYRRRTRGREIVPGHPVADVLGRRPNGRQTPFEIKALITAQALLTGNGLARIRPGPRGAVDSLTPLPVPARAVTIDEASDGGLRYRFRPPNGGAEVTLLEDEVFHLRGLSSDGIHGLSLTDALAVEAIGLALATERYGAAFFGRGSRPSGVLKHPGRLTDEAADRISADWAERHSGLANAHKPVVLEEGMDWQSTTHTAEEAQFLQTREMQVEEIARWFRVPPHMIGSTVKATTWGTGIEQMSRGFVTYTLQPWMTRWEETIGKDLITLDEIFYAKFVPEALLRASTKERYESYQIAAGGNAPWMTRNEIRELEERDPMDGLDEPLAPLNMRSLGDGPDLPTRTGAAGELVRAGFDPSDALGTVGLPPMDHLGLPPVTVQPARELANAEQPPAAARPAPPPAPAGASVHHRLLVEDAAARAARREIGLAARVARANAADAAVFMAALEREFDEHAEWLARALHISPALAERACGDALAALAEGGAATLETWEQERTPALVALALGMEVTA